MGALPNVFSGYQPVADAAARKKFEEAWGVQGLEDKPGLTIAEMMTAALRGDVRALYVMGENPMMSDPDTSHIEQALSSLDFLVVQDIFLSETAEKADVVLPAASFAERDGTYTNTERRVQLSRKAVSPPGLARPDWEIICEVSRLSGYPMDYSSTADIMKEINLLTPGSKRPTDCNGPVPTRSTRARPICTGTGFPRAVGRFSPATSGRSPNRPMRSMTSR
jgi:predicted molibdopterin-dependent oxidoreductase YjgC